MRDRAILSTLLYHALRREELCKLKVRDFRHARVGVPHLGVSGKGDKTRYLPLHPGTHALIHELLTPPAMVKTKWRVVPADPQQPTGRLDKAIEPDIIYRLVRPYSAELGFQIGAHALRDGCHQRARSSGRHRQGAGVAWACEYCHHPHLRSSKYPTRE